MPRMGRHGMYAHLTREQRARLTRRRAQQQEHLAQRRGAARSCVWRTRKTAAPPRTNGDSARTASTAPPHPKKIKMLKRNTQEWQDSRVVHDSRGLCSEKTPSWQDLRAVYSRKAICRAFRIHGARILPKSAHFGCMAAYVARKGCFSRPRHLLGYMKRKTCHGLPPGNAPRRNIAIARHPRTHRGVTEPGDATRTKHRPIQHRMLTRPRNHENILVPSAKKRR